MARQFYISRLRLLIAGVSITFILSVVYGISILQPNSLGCNCPATSKHLDSRLDGGEEHQKDFHPDDHKLCVLVPFRDRFEELLEFVPFLGAFLDRQNVRHRIVVINQLDQYRFNRASLINVGFLQTRQDCDYIAMHDVDLLPLNDELSYAFPAAGPFHVAAPWLHPLYHYKSFVGGILLVQSKHFDMLNGLSNKYWGWGREDDEFFVRMKKANLELHRPGNLTTGYKSFKHIHDKRKRPRDHRKYFDQWKKTNRLDKVTGLTTVEYNLDTSHQLTIEGAKVTVLNVYLECDLDLTPWCLGEDHPQFKTQVEKEKIKAKEREKEREKYE